MRNVYTFQELRGSAILFCFLSEKLKATICTLESEIQLAAGCMHSFLKQGKHRPFLLCSGSSVKKVSSQINFETISAMAELNR